MPRRWCRREPARRCRPRSAPPPALPEPGCPRGRRGTGSPAPSWRPRMSACGKGYHAAEAVARSSVPKPRRLPSSGREVVDYDVSSKPPEVDMRRDFLLPALLLAAAACGSSSSGKECTKTLTHGTDDQTAVQTALIGAKSGDLVCFSAGTFTFTDELSLSVSGVTLRGAGKATTILDFSAQATGGNALKVTGGDFIVEHLTVKDPKGDGIRTEGVTNVTFRDIRVYWSAGPRSGNGAYGVYPVLTTNVLIDGIEVSGAADAAIYVGQSKNILVQSSTAFDSVAGIEIENSTDAEVVNNTSHDNV